jgi:MFS transporter, putative metabolite:H+ symporter
MCGTGSGVIAASSRFGGILGAGLALVGFFDNLVISAVLLAVPMVLSAALPWNSGMETRGFGLEEIQRAIKA